MDAYLTATPDPDADKRVRVYRFEDVMELMAISKRNLYRLIETGDLEVVTVSPSGRAKRITARSIAAYYDRNKGTAA